MAEPQWGDDCALLGLDLSAPQSGNGSKHAESWVNICLPS